MIKEQIIAVRMDALPCWQKVQYIYLDGVFYVNPDHIGTIIAEGGILAERLKCGDYQIPEHIREAATPAKDEAASTTD